MENIKSIFETTAVYDDRFKCYCCFGITSKGAELYGYGAKDIVTVKMRVTDNQEKPKVSNAVDVDYWGMYDIENKSFDLIYHNRLGFETQFCYSVENHELKDNMKACRLEIVK